MAETEAAAATAPIAFDKRVAVELGLLVQATYTMSAAGGLTPAPTAIPPAYRFVAWVQMEDFFIGGTELQFYGIVVQEVARPGHYVVAIRGTQGDIEWFDDLTALIPVAWPGGGRVGLGFSKIYGTLRIVDAQAADNRMGARVAEPGGSFADQVERVTRRHHLSITGVAAPAPVTVTATGHSLGAALATLYVSDSHRARYQSARLLCTFASPFVGDAAFAQAFDGLGIASWRISNRPDIVPKLPPFEYEHVQVAEPVDSGNQTVISLRDPKLMVGCWHSLQTYLHMLDDSIPIEAACRPQAAVFSARRMMVAEPPKPDMSVTVPREGATTVTITIKVGGSS